MGTETIRAEANKTKGETNKTGEKSKTRRKIVKLGGKIMANHIGLHEKSEEGFMVSNGGTDALISILGLSGTRLAKSEDEKCLIVWLLEHDQSCRGRGAVDFYLAELPWDKDKFEVQQKFLLSVLDGVKQEIGWNNLDYRPNKEIMLQYIQKLSCLIEKMESDMIDERAGIEWREAAKENDPILCGFPKCEKHSVFLTLFGCQICNDR